MPVMDGVSFIEYAKNNGLRAGIIVLSCRDEYEYVRSSLRQGVFDYILKHSVDPQALVTTIQNCYASKNSNQKNTTQQLLAQAAPVKKSLVQPKQEEPPEQQSGNGDVNTALTYIHNHYTEPLTLQSLADAVYLTKNYFSYLFKQHVGEPVTEYILNYRLEQSLLLLSNSHEKVYAVACAVGFQNQYYFIKSFKKRYGMSPALYRKKQKDLPE